MRAAILIFFGAVTILNRMKSGPPSRLELTHIKYYRDWEVDEGSSDTLTHIHGYPNYEHESLL